MSYQSSEEDRQLKLRAQRVQRWIYIAMAICIALPFILAWFSGAIRF